uniref:Uncharacterized protein n=1 Tax=Anguilla anguilla TaxID=7936 RepID=A0A0E9UYD5_ANGAN
MVGQQAFCSGNQMNHSEQGIRDHKDQSDVMLRSQLLCKFNQDPRIDTTKSSRGS